MRQSGVLLHITSLPSPEGIGTLGREARQFVGFLRQAGMRIWQVLPISPTGYAESPYQCFSTYAGNPLLIDLRALRRRGILTTQEEPPSAPREDQVNFAALIPWKNRMLSLAFEQSYARLERKVNAFRRKNAL